MRQSLNEIKNVIDKHGYSINNIICYVMKKFNFKTICNKSGASSVKEDGYSVSEIITLIIMLPLMNLNTVNSFYKSIFTNITEMKKDAIYRLKNNEKMPWRNLLYGVCKMFINLVNPNGTIHEKSAFIVDDTPDMKTGYAMERVSIIHNHGSGPKGNTLGFKKLVLALYDGKSIMPVDASIHSERKLTAKKRKNQYKKNCIKNSNGYKRRKECDIKKNENALKLLKRAVKKGLIAKYVLADSWFGSENFIKTIREIKNGALHVVCGIRKDKRYYEYEGCRLNAKEIISKLTKEKKQKRCRKWNTRYFEVTVNYSTIGSVKLYICRFPYQKEWRVFLSTNTSLSFTGMMEVYSIRWSIEVLFKECKQYLGLCKCQSRDFDAQIANITVCFILYVFLSYFRRINAYEPLGQLFETIKDDMCEKSLAERLWALFDELLQVVIESIAETGVVNILDFKKSLEYQYIKELFDESFLSTQILGVNAY